MRKMIVKLATRDAQSAELQLIGRATACELTIAASSDRFCTTLHEKSVAPWGLEPT